jgi:hypothetical protein
MTLTAATPALPGRIASIFAVTFLAAAPGPTATAAAIVPRGDMNADQSVAGDDAPLFVDALLDPSPDPTIAARGDFTADGLLTDADVPAFVRALLGLGGCCIDDATCTDDVTAGQCASMGGVFLGLAVDCPAAPPPCATANLTAYRPRQGAGYFPFARTAVADNDEDDAAFGPGIRINSPGDADPAGEDDLIEVVVFVTPADADFVLRRADTAIRAWLTSDKLSGTEIPFDANDRAALPNAQATGTLTVFIEWATAAHGTATLSIEPAADATPLDTLTFHTFTGIVLALGGEDQVPSLPVNTNHGTFVVATALYERGFDVHKYDEDNVSADGSGPVYNAAVDAIANRSVGDVAIYGYSHGGGSTYDLADRLDFNRLSIGTFVIQFTSYADSVSNNSDVDVAMELRRPPSTGYHLNHYQEGSFFEDFLLDGGPVPDSNPPPTGLNVETTPWGANSTHFTVDDYLEVRSAIEGDLTSLTAP